MTFLLLNLISMHIFFLLQLSCIFHCLVLLPHLEFSLLLTHLTLFSYFPGYFFSVFLKVTSCTEMLKVDFARIFAFISFIFSLYLLFLSGWSTPWLHVLYANNYNSTFQIYLHFSWAKQLYILDLGIGVLYDISDQNIK